MQEPIDRYFAAHGFELKISMRLDSSDLIKAIVRAELGISMLPLWVVESDVKDRTLSLIHQIERPLYSKLELVRRRRSFVPRPVQAFVAVAKGLDPRQLRLLTCSRAYRRALAEST